MTSQGTVTPPAPRGLSTLGAMAVCTRGAPGTASPRQRCGGVSARPRPLGARVAAPASPRPESPPPGTRAPRGCSRQRERGHLPRGKPALTCRARRPENTGPGEARRPGRASATARFPSGSNPGPRREKPGGRRLRGAAEDTRDAAGSRERSDSWPGCWGRVCVTCS